MKPECIPVEQLERVASLPAGHAGRAHLDACDRCQAMLLLLREFTTPSAQPEADVDAVDARLRSIVDGVFGQPGAAVADGDTGAAAPSPKVLPLPLPRAATRPWHLQPGALAFAAGLVIVSALAVIALRPGHVLMRGSEPAGAPRALEPVRTSDGERLAWTRQAGADAYRVLLFDRGMTEIARLGPVADTLLVLEHANLPSGVRSGDRLGWQVEALAGGDVQARSRVRAVVAP
jgi:hypothetical protein